MKTPTLNFSNGVFWRETGMRLEVQRINGTSDRFLKVDDLNPQAQIVQRLSRFECIRLGLFFIWRAAFARTPH